MSRDIKALFGAKVRQVRLSKNLTQEQLAEKAKLHPTYIGRIERGKQNPSLTNIYKLYTTLKVSINQIFPD